MDQRKQSVPADRPVLLLVATDDVLRREWRAWVAGAFPHCRAAEADTPEILRWALCRSSPRVVVMDLAGLGARADSYLRLVRSLAPQAEHLALTAVEGYCTGTDHYGETARPAVFKALQLVIETVLRTASPGLGAPS